MTNSVENFYNPNQIVELNQAIEMCDSELHFTGDTVGFNLIGSSGECLIQFGASLEQDGTTDYFVFESTLPFERKQMTLDQLTARLKELQPNSTCEHIASIN